MSEKYQNVQCGNNEKKQEEESLIRKYAEGNSDAAEELFEKYKLLVYNLAFTYFEPYKIWGLKERAEDITQETFRKVFQYAPSFKGNSGTEDKKWIMVIAHNTCTDFYRKQKRSYDYNTLPEEDENHSWEDAYSAIIFNDLIKNLSVIEQQIIRLHFVSKLSHTDIADMLDMSVTTIRKKEKRAFIKIKREMGGKNNE